MDDKWVAFKWLLVQGPGIKQKSTEKHKAKRIDIEKIQEAEEYTTSLILQTR